MSVLNFSHSSSSTRLILLNNFKHFLFISAVGQVGHFPRDSFIFGSVKFLLFFKSATLSVACQMPSTGRRVRISASSEQDQVHVYDNETQSGAVKIREKRELARLESLVRCQVHVQWQLSIDNYRLIQLKLI